MHRFAQTLLLTLAGLLSCAAVPTPAGPAVERIVVHFPIETASRLMPDGTFMVAACVLWAYFESDGTEGAVEFVFDRQHCLIGGSPDPRAIIDTEQELAAVLRAYLRLKGDHVYEEPAADDSRTGLWKAAEK